MACFVEYHDSVRRRIAPTVAVFGLLFLLASLVPSSFGQINGVPASVTSPGFGGRAINGTPPSVTSLGPRGFTPNPTAGVQFFTNVPRHDSGVDRDHHRHHRTENFFPVYGSALYPVYVPVPYQQDQPETEQYADDESEYQGGPTIFDRRGRGEETYVPPVKDALPAHAGERVDFTPAPPEPPQEPTLLVFKDGHQIEVGNYAIVGQTLFDLTPGHSRRIAIADLDLDATQKKNDERGVSFQLPPTAQAN
ncbi:MAG: hypothetical protein LAO24_02965 [Acidobacteriia bacterium]|nr:hypothetical protein [Terriglobia bacterium]